MEVLTRKLQWMALMGFRRRQKHSHATQSQMELKKTKMKVYNSMISLVHKAILQKSKLQCYTPVAEMERRRKITAQRKALKSEGTMGHVN